MLPLGSQLSRFRPSDATLAERIRRIESGAPLRTLMVGSFSYQKGALDLEEVAKSARGRFEFRFVGDLPKETRALRLRMSSRTVSCSVRGSRADEQGPDK